VHSRFHDIKYYVFWTGYFCTPARSLNTPRWVITRVLPGTDCGTFVMMVGALVTWAIHTQGQLLLWSSLIITGLVPGYKWPRWLRLRLSGFNPLTKPCESEYDRKMSRPPSWKPFEKITRRKVRRFVWCLRFFLNHFERHTSSLSL